jgi:hypothetical protein
MRASYESFFKLPYKGSNFSRFSFRSLPILAHANDESLASRQAIIGTRGFLTTLITNLKSVFESDPDSGFCGKFKFQILKVGKMTSNRADFW